ncbi:MAG: hypothetical protein CSA84_02360 [Actinomycetales bacterium]|nr:MAG: hypothetical protein CSA84_02360 [Actinomycetales bacterium]
MTDPTSLPNFPPPEDEHPLRGRVLDVVKDLGINPNIDADGDVAFSLGEPSQQLFVRCQDGEFPIMRVFGQWQLGAPVSEDPLERLMRCNDFTLQLHVAKVNIAGGSLVVSCDHLVLPETDLSELFKVTVDLILQVVGAWFGSWDEGRNDAPGSGGNDE